MAYTARNGERLQGDYSNVIVIVPDGTSVDIDTRIRIKELRVGSNAQVLAQNSTFGRVILDPNAIFHANNSNFAHGIERNGKTLCMGATNTDVDATPGSFNSSGGAYSVGVSRAKNSGSQRPTQVRQTHAHVSEEPTLIDITVDDGKFDPWDVIKSVFQRNRS